MDNSKPQSVDRLDHVNLSELTAEVVSSFVSNNTVPVVALANLIRTVHRAMLGMGQPSPAVRDDAAKPTPVQVRKSISDDALTSFEDGRAYRTLKRHLNGRGLTPEAYRAKHGLPVDYPMTAPGYSRQRSATSP